MSQFNAPPPPPGAMPPGYGPPMGYGQPMQPQTTSVAAVISLISGILGCFIITGLIAVITGIIGIKATSSPNVKGRGLAITGLILGLLFGGIGIAGTAGFYGLYKYGIAQLENGKTFTNAVIAGDYSTAMQYTTMDRTEVESLGEQMKGWGNITDITLLGGDTSKNVGEPQSMVLKGSVTFSNAGKKEFELELLESAGKLKVKKILFK